MKKHFKSYIAIGMITIILMLPLFQNGYHSGHDTKFHIANVLAVKEQFQKGNLTSPILPHIANNFGYGTRLFYPVLPHTVTAVISVLLTPITSHVTNAFKIVHLLTIFLSAITMYHCSYKFSKNTFHALACIGNSLYHYAIFSFQHL